MVVGTTVKQVEMVVQVVEQVVHQQRVDLLLKVIVMVELDMDMTDLVGGIITQMVVLQVAVVEQVTQVMVIQEQQEKHQTGEQEDLTT